MTQTSPAAARQLDAIPVHRKSLSQRLRENWQLYVMLLIPAASGAACTGLNGSSPHPTVCA